MYYQNYTDAMMKGLLHQLPANTHKYQRGVLGIFAGSDRYPGSATLCAEAATRTGSGYTYVVTTEQAAPLIWYRHPSITVLSEQAQNGALPKNAYDDASELIEKSDALIIGPGLTVTDDTCRIVERICKTYTGPCVIDADGLNCLIALANDESGPRGQICQGANAAARILTPHAGELERMLVLCTSRGPNGREGYQVFDVIRQRGELEEALRSHIDRTENTGVYEHIAKAMKLACDLDCIVVAKGPLTVIASQERISVSDIGTPALAKAGSGDVLTGIIGSLAAQGVAPFDAAVLGVHLQGLAGRLAQGAWGQRGVCAEDVITAIPAVMRDFFGF